MTCICVDAMGGDEEPRVVLDGIAAALAADPGLEVLVAGNDEHVTPFCKDHDRARPLVTTQVIGMGEHPAEAVRAKKDSSIVRGCQAVHAGEAEGFFSAGSTGAIFAAATLGVRPIRGIRRPAIASAVPSPSDKKTVVLDLGANADARPEMLVQFAHMGRAYAHVTLGVEDPQVALLSNGSEDAKGSEASQAAFAALKAAGGGDADGAGRWFCGNCEGTDILAGRYDVIVTDGFTGNVALKSLEGTAKFFVSMIKKSVKESKKSALGALLLKDALKDVAAELSGDVYGGAILLGLRAPVLIGHGATSVEAVKNGTLACASAVRGKLVERISEMIEQGA